MTTTIAQGALSGGGFVGRIGISNDGTTRFINYDGSNCFVWNFTTSQWDNAFAQDNLPAAFRTWGQNVASSVGITAPLIAVAPSRSVRLYALAVHAPTAAEEGMFWRSDDRGRNWIDTGNRFPIGVTGNRGIGPPIAVDPANPDVVYFSDNSGVVHISTDAGDTWSTPSAIYTHLINATATAATATGANVLTIGGGTPASVSTRGGYDVYVSDVSRANGITDASYVSGTTATTVTLIYNITGSAGVVNGDTLVFGGPASIVFDPSSAVVGGKTQGIYIGWAYGASAVYHSTDGGTTWTATTGGPAKVLNMSCSADGILYAVEYGTSGRTDTTNAWKYSSGTWTNFSIAGFSGNNFNSVSADPLNSGHVAFVIMAGSIQMSGDYGANWYSAFTGSSSDAPVRSAGDVAWLGPYNGTPVPPLGTVENYQSNGSILFDPSSSGKLWIAEGIGVWYCTPPVAPATLPSITITGINKNQQGMILDQLIKPPGGALLGVGQDRSGFYLPSRVVEPVGDMGIFEQIGGDLATLQSGWAIDYSKADPTFAVAVIVTNAWKSTNGGKSWSKITPQPSGVNIGGAIACQTLNNFVWFPGNDGTPAYTTDGGATWNNCLFAGSTLSTGWAFSALLNRHNVVADLVDGATFYAINYSPNSSGGCWRSTDGGANWTNRTGGISNISTSGSADFQLIAVPSNQGHLMLGNGSTANNNLQLMRSVDAGATWVAVTTTGTCWQVAAGRAAAAGAHPAVYITGTISGDSDPGIFMTDGFTGNTAVMPAWTRLCRAPAGNMDTAKSLCADLDTYGSFYLATGGTGYVYGAIVIDTPISQPRRRGGHQHVHFFSDWKPAR